MNIYFRKTVNKNWIHRSDFSHFGFRRSTGTIIPMSFSSCFSHATYHLHATSHPHFTIFVFSTHKNSKNIKTGWKDNKVKLPASAAFFVLLWAKIGSVEWEENGEIGDSSKDSQYSDGIFYRIKIWDDSYSESGRSSDTKPLPASKRKLTGLTSEAIPQL